MTLSPIFLTGSKPGHGPALGLAGLAAAAASVDGPILALAGITLDNAPRLPRTPAPRGIAVMGEVMRAANPEATVRALICALALSRD